MCSAFLFSLSSRHRRAIQKSRGSKVRRAEGTMESEQGAPASTVSSAGTTTSTTTSSSSSSSTTTASSNSTANTTVTTTTISSIISTSSSSSNTINSSSSSSGGGGSTTTGRQSVPQISVYSGIPDRQTVQVSFLALIKLLTAWCSVVILCVMCRHSQTSVNTNGQMLAYFPLLYCPLLVYTRPHTDFWWIGANELN